VNAQTQAELLKIRSTRTTIGIVLGMIALVLLFSLLSGLLTKQPDLTSTEDQRGLLSVGSLAGVFSALAGIMLVTSEYRFGTIRPTFLFTPRRSRVVGAKLAAGLLAGIAFGVVGEGIGFAIGYATLTGRGIGYAMNGSQTTLLVLGTLAGVALWGALGVGLGVVVRNQVGGIIGLLAWGFVAENLLFASSHRSAASDLSTPKTPSWDSPPNISSPPQRAAPPSSPGRSCSHSPAPRLPYAATSPNSLRARGTHEPPDAGHRLASSSTRALLPPPTHAC
jgi:hypothetical protein